jgi:hypothetical protein
MSLGKFVGTWKLLSFETRREDGVVIDASRRDWSGYIMYTGDGYMCATLFAPNRRKFNTPDVLGGTIEEKVAAADSYVSYYGRYEVDEDRVIHHVEASFFPNWVGVDQVRFYGFDGDRLTLRTAPMPVGGLIGCVHLIWEKC